MASYGLYTLLTATGNATGTELTTGNNDQRTFQAVCTGTGAVTATVTIQGSLDKTNWVTITTLSLSGTAPQTASYEHSSAWTYIRATSASVTGTGATVNVYVSLNRKREERISDNNAFALNVKDFGAKGDGVTDDTAALQSAMNAASASGVPLVLGPQTYCYSGILTANCSIVGVGSASYLKHIGNKGEDSRLQFTAVSGLQLRNFRIGSPTADGTYVTEDEAQLRLSSCTDFVVSGVIFDNAPGTCVLMYGCSNGVVHGNVINSCWKDGFHCTDGTNNVAIIGNTCDDGGDDVVAIVGYTSQASPPQNIAVTGNVINGTKSARGITVVGGARVSITGNVVREAYLSGIYIASEAGGFNTTAPENVTVTGNTVYRCGRASPASAAILVAGVASYRPKHIRIANNQIVESSYRAIQVFGVSSHPAEYVSITGNTIRDTTDLAARNGTAGTQSDDGISASAHCFNLDIIDNVVESVGGYGVYVEASMTGRVRVCGNSLRNINVNGSGAVVDAIHVATSNTASVIEIEGNELTTQATAIHRFIEASNPGKTRFGRNFAPASYAIINGIANATITPTGSPYTYTNSGSTELEVTISGGTVSNVELSADGTNFFAASKTTGGVGYYLRPGSQIRVTYSVAPTMVSKQVTI